MKKLQKKNLIDEFIFFLQQNYPDFFIFEMNYLERKLFIETFFNCMEQEFFVALSSKKRIEIRDFGIWFSKKTKQREINNPLQDKKLIISERSLPRFRAGKRLIEKLNIETQENKNNVNPSQNKNSVFKKYLKKVFLR